MLRQDLANGESERLNHYKGLLKDIHNSIKKICKEVQDVRKGSSEMIADLSRERSQGAAEWNKMQNTVASLRKTGLATSPKEEAGKTEKKKAAAKPVKYETVKVSPVKSVKETKIETAVKEIPVKALEEINIEGKRKVPTEVVTRKETKPVLAQMTLEEKVLDFINRNPMGVKVSEMEQPLSETRMKLGFIAKALLDAGKVQKMDNVYFPIK